MEWEKVLRDSVQDNRIKDVHLMKIPQLKNCENWKKIEPIGYIDAELKHTHYKGMLVKLSGKIYFVSSNTMEALSEFISWTVKEKIDVYTDK